jgi:signal transduction histidine kinase
VGRSTPRRLDDGSVTWYGYLEDVTDRHERDEARRAAELAQAASQAKTEFLSRMSHELRTPLNAMLGFAQLLEIDTEDPASDGQRRRLQHIREAGAHLVAMLGELLDLTRVESGHLALQLEAVPLHELAVETLTMVQPDADRAQVRLSLQMAGEVAARADRLRLRQVLLNLLGNAIKYNRPGGRVELRVEAPADGRVRVQVCDDGVGIAEADLPRLFEPFHRGRHAGGPISGTGIGLSLSQRLAQAMGGTLDASVAPGQDTVFNLWLPRA